MRHIDTSQLIPANVLIRTLRELQDQLDECFTDEERAVVLKRSGPAAWDQWCDVLSELSCGKCWFSEAPVDNRAREDCRNGWVVDHQTPVFTNTSVPRLAPGAVAATDWRQLRLLCERRYSARRQEDAGNVEILDPTAPEDSQHLSFRIDGQVQAVAQDPSSRLRASDTIRIVGLDCEFLRRRREEVWRDAQTAAHEFLDAIASKRDIHVAFGKLGKICGKNSAFSQVAVTAVREFWSRQRGPIRDHLLEWWGRLIDQQE